MGTISKAITDLLNEYVRVCYGLDPDTKYAASGVGRWQALAGNKAAFGGDGGTFESVGRDRQRTAA
jgi:hypothetical protein